MKNAIIILCLLCCITIEVHAQEPGTASQEPKLHKSKFFADAQKPGQQKTKLHSSTVSLTPQTPDKQKPKWYENIVVEGYGYYWMTSGRTSHRHITDNEPGKYSFSHLKYKTNDNMYIAGSEAGYKFDLPFLKRFTGNYEVSQGSSTTMHGIDSDPVFTDPSQTTFLGYEGWAIQSGRDDSKYINASLIYRPLEGRIHKDVKGYFDIIGEWIRYKDRPVIESDTYFYSPDDNDINDFQMAVDPGVDPPLFPPPND
ncbi:MAG: hypothetical protein GY800_10205 [Planctomycetes bacterium]|nr:hypothetical protein [Planctomycetota bacterium]